MSNSETDNIQNKLEINFFNDLLNDGHLIIRPVVKGVYSEEVDLIILHKDATVWQNYNQTNHKNSIKNI